MAEPTESFRILLLGGRTLDRRKWCWSWHGGADSAGFWACWSGLGPTRFGEGSRRSGAEPGLRAAAADGLRISTGSSPFVLRSSLACSPLSSSAQPSGFLDGFLLPSAPIGSLEPSVMLPGHIRARYVTFWGGKAACEIKLLKTTFASLKHGRRCLFQIPSTVPTKQRRIYALNVSKSPEWTV